jgi:hypothetical protein
MCLLRWVLAPSALLADLYAGWVLGSREDIEYVFSANPGSLDARADDWEDGAELWLARR